MGDLGLRAAGRWAALTAVATALRLAVAGETDAGGVSSSGGGGWELEES